MTHSHFGDAFPSYSCRAQPESQPDWLMFSTCFNPSQKRQKYWWVGTLTVMDKVEGVKNLWTHTLFYALSFPFMPFSSWVSWRTGFGDGTRNHIISWEIFGRWGVRKHWIVCVQCHEVAQHAQHAQPRLGDCATNATSPHQVACVRTHIEATKKTHNRKHPLGSSCAHHISLWKAWCALENITHTTPTGCRSHTAIWGHQVTRNFGKGPFSAMNFLMTSFGGVVVPSS